jgi:hypothetical protein
MDFGTWYWLPGFVEGMSATVVHPFFAEWPASVLSAGDGSNAAHGHAAAL